MPEDSLFLRCRDCDDTFELTPDNQRYFESKGLSLPKRCVPCRRIKREQTQAPRAPLRVKYD